MTDDEGFERVAETVRQSVGTYVLGLVTEAEPYADATQAVLLGALAGVVECFVAKAQTPLPRTMEALCDAVRDFARQAHENQQVVQ